MSIKDDKVMADLQSMGTKDSLSTFAQVGEYYAPWKWTLGKCLKPGRKITRKPGMIKPERMVL